MKLGDFSSLVQVGIGLHAGAGLLQLFSEFGLEPLERRLTRLDGYLLRRGLPPEDPRRERIEDLKGSLTIFKIQLSNEHRKYVITNFVVAGFLLFVLVVISFLNDEQIEWGYALLLAGVCCLPAIYSVIIYFRRATPQIQALQHQILSLERNLFPRQSNDLLHTGKLSCFRPGISTVFPRSIASARAMRGRVACGMITSSI